ncbi:MAG TPA: hypothetical protein VLZ12_02900 [Verrucomicrobiae bacterium]|nr:hypothetical protein [Verrucomicrobiae bacterium]
MRKIAAISMVFVVVCLASARTRGADVSLYAVTKAQAYIQSNAISPTLLSTGAYSFTAAVLEQSNFVTSATVQLPSMANVTLTNLGGSLWDFTDLFAAQTNMDAIYGSGTYHFNIVTVNDGTKTPTLSLTGNSYPNAPTITNYDAAQLIAATNNFTLLWSPFVGGGSGDIIELVILDDHGDVVYQSPAPLQSGALNGTSKSVVIPANTLLPGRDYSGVLAFVKVTQLNILGYFGAIGVAGYSSGTDFNMHTLTTPALSINLDTNQVIRLEFAADVGRHYEIQAKPDLLTSSWSSIFITNAATNVIKYLDTDSTSLTQRFYRLGASP